MLSPSLSLTFSESTFSESIIIFRCFATASAALTSCTAPLWQAFCGLELCVRAAIFGCPRTRDTTHLSSGRLAGSHSACEDPLTLVPAALTTRLQDKAGVDLLSEDGTPQRIPGSIAAQ